MLKLEVNRRHLVGLAGLALAIAVLGFVETQDLGARRIAALPEAVFPQTAQENAESGVENRFLSDLSRLPKNAYGSAKALLPTSDEVLDKAASTLWSDREWRAAAKAVAGLRDAAKTKAVDMSAIKWRPPEEIASQSR